MYRVEIKPKALKELDWFPPYLQIKAITAIDSLVINPRPLGSKKLHGASDRWRIRIGDYRILYKIDDRMKTVSVYRALHRKDVYR